MVKPTQASSKIARIICMFPTLKVEIQELYLRDLRFRELCEDLLLAYESAERLAAGRKSPDQPEIVEYNEIIAALENEVREYVDSKGG